MIECKYIEGQKHDELLKRVAAATIKAVTSKNDDSIELFVGDTGTGKSSLGAHYVTELDPDFSVDYVSFTRDGFAKVLQAVSQKKGLRIAFNDEANISKRDSLTKFNKDMIDLYFSIRGLNIIHVWCNPSLDMLDKVFIEERIKGVFYVYSKGENVRRYYYFPVKNLLKILEKYKNLKLKTLKQVAGKYALYCGWFTKFEGEWWERYLEKKQFRMVEKVNDFFYKYAKPKGKTEPLTINFVDEKRDPVVINERKTLLRP